MTMRRIECTCGALRLAVEGEPIKVSVCHCFTCRFDCQKRSGSVFAAQARFARACVSVTGEYHRYTRTADSGDPVHFHFCPTCATYSVYEERMHHWVTLPEDMAHLA